MEVGLDVCGSCEVLVGERKTLWIVTHAVPEIARALSELGEVQVGATGAVDQQSEVAVLIDDGDAL